MTHYDFYDWPRDTTYLQISIDNIIVYFTNTTKTNNAKKSIKKSSNDIIIKYSLICSPGWTDENESYRNFISETMAESCKKHNCELVHVHVGLTIFDREFSANVMVNFKNEGPYAIQQMLDSTYGDLLTDTQLTTLLTTSDRLFRHIPYKCFYKTDKVNQEKEISNTYVKHTVEMKAILKSVEDSKEEVYIATHDVAQLVQMNKLSEEMHFFDYNFSMDISLDRVVFSCYHHQQYEVSITNMFSDVYIVFSNKKYNFTGIIPSISYKNVIQYYPIKITCGFNNNIFDTKTLEFYFIITYKTYSSLYLFHKNTATINEITTRKKPWNIHIDMFNITVENNKRVISTLNEMHLNSYFESPPEIFIIDVISSTYPIFCMYLLNKIELTSSKTFLIHNLMFNKTKIEIDFPNNIFVIVQHQKKYWFLHFSSSHNVDERALSKIKVESLILNPPLKTRIQPVNSLI